MFITKRYLLSEHKRNEKLKHSLTTRFPEGKLKSHSSSMKIRVSGNDAI
jgi:hypothetical protein